VRDLNTGTPRKRKKTEPFSQVPLDWAARAARATETSASLVYVRIIHLAWKAKGQSFPLASKWLEERGTSRKVKMRALRDLEADGLITTERMPGKAPQITLIEPGPSLGRV
jgi:DNA-binding FadR family transcriptional regulator